MPRLLVALVVASVVYAAPPAPRLMALLEDGTLVVFRPGDATGRTFAPTGVSGKLVGIDVRPADGKLYGLAGGTDIYRIDPETGAATLVSTLTVPFDGDVRSGVDFTPQLDRLRLVSIDGRNMRVNVDLGATAVDTPLAYAPNDLHAGTRPRITAAGYGNNRPGVATTTLFEIDAGLDILVIQDPANDGVLRTVGPLGVDADELAGLDVLTDADGHDWAWAAWGRSLFTIDLATGRATPAGAVPGASRPVVSLTVIDDAARP
jgi:trimeric autotransporter adhesin